jgi:hypothetical protein
LDSAGQGPQDDRPPYWPAKAESLVGKTVLVGLTYVNAQHEAAEQRQYHGVIERADERDGFAVRRADTGELEWLPPDLRAFETAAPGEYRLRSTGEVVVDPDLLSTWTIEWSAE